MLQESIRIPGSGLHLMYRSSLASGYLSKVVMRLTRSQIPKSLVKVHVRVEIEGSVHTKIYEADPNLTHIFAWNKRNVYKQKVSNQNPFEITNQVIRGVNFNKSISRCMVLLKP